MAARSWRCARPARRIGRGRDVDRRGDDGGTGVTRRTVAILGATGSVGTSTLDLVERFPERFEVIALTAARNVALLAEAARRTNAKLAVIDDVTLLGELEQRLAGSG
ncbi:MAG: hypothetical protein H0W92_02295, partial [Sphingomonas sp.]|nr:hypothetical protein [Sphingomonas sp.]